MIKDKEWFELRKQIAGCRECKSLTKVWLVALSTFADETGFCYPNQTQIAERMGRDSRKNLERCLKQAAECGHIVIGHKITTSGKSNNYQLALTTPHSEVTMPHSEVTNPHSGYYNTYNNSSTTSSIDEALEFSCLRDDYFEFLPLKSFTHFLPFEKSDAPLEHNEEEEVKECGVSIFDEAKARQQRINEEVLAEKITPPPAPKRKTLAEQHIDAQAVINAEFAGVMK